MAKNILKCYVHLKYIQEKISTVVELDGTWPPVHRELLAMYSLITSEEQAQK
jgi:hypothetical protein